MSNLQKKILYIEDEPEMIDLVRLILNRGGYSVVGAETGQEGITIAQQVQPDLILLDLIMPDMDGWAVCRQLQSDERTIAIPIIVITGRPHRLDDVLDIHIAKVDGYLTKPFTPNELLDKVEWVFSR